MAPIGMGGMGEVYKARDARLDRIVAIKVSQEKFSERFEREARAVAALNHPHICTLYDVGTDYLVMEYIEGAPIKGPLPLDRALKYAVQICDALDAAHQKGITHRDLKPGNILVTKAGIKLLDFGLAKQSRDREAAVVDATMTKALTGEGRIVGTLHYMSPEQLQGQEADPRSDIYLVRRGPIRDADRETGLCGSQPGQCNRRHSGARSALSVRCRSCGVGSRAAPLPG